jgi:hypothetical protein
MNRIDEILGFQRPEDVSETYGLESAFCGCLQPDEACELLGVCAAERLDVRVGVLRKVCADIDQSQRPCHND